jgi:hypothetical protein
VGARAVVDIVFLPVLTLQAMSINLFRVHVTLTIDPDVLARAKEHAAKCGRTWEEVVDEAIRLGLEQLLKPVAPREYSMTPLLSGLKPGFSYDNIGYLLAAGEGKDHR